MRSSSVLWSCSALALILTGCGAGQGGGGFAPQPASRAAQLAQGVQPDTVSGIAEFTTNTGQANGIASDGVGHVYVGSEEPGPSLLAFDEATHAIVQFDLPKPATGMYALAPQGSTAMWFTDDNIVGFMNLSNHTFQEFKVPTHAAEIEGIAAGPSNTMWFTEAHVGKVGRINTNNHGIAEFTLPSPNSPFGITRGKDGAEWFANYHSIDRITSNGQLTGYSLGSNYAAGVTNGPDGSIWFTGQSDQGGAIVGRIDFNAHTVHIAKFGAGSGGDIAIVARGSLLWMTAPNANKIDRYDPQDHTIYRRSLPQGFTQPFAMTLGADDQLWFTNNGAQGSAIGKLCPDLSSDQCATSP
ncbi:MAG: hypothetical protein WA814_00875 [Candidatus Baltobacteraceae bacterium]